MSNLIDETERLAKLAPKPRDPRKIQFDRLTKDIEYNSGLRTAAPKMLKVLSLFQKGDAEVLKFIENDLEYYCKRLGGTKGDGAIEEENLLHRLQKAARLMESKE